MKLPSLQFYPGDWKKDPGVQSLSYEDRGIWFEIMLLMFESSERGKLMLNGKPMPDDALARLLGLDKQILTTTITTLLTYGVASREENSGALICRRMVRDEEIRKTRADCGKLGGNPILVKQIPTTGVKQIPTPSSSSSSSKLTLVDAIEERTRRPTKEKSKMEREFDEDWPKFWKRVAPDAAFKAYQKARKKVSREVLMAKVVEHGPRLVAEADRRGGTVVYPASWLNDGRWKDEIVGQQPMFIPLPAAKSLDQEFPR
jgi:hypothetical protein